MDTTQLLARVDALVSTFVDEKLSDDETSFCFSEAEKLAEAVGIHVSTVIGRAKDAGLLYTGRVVPRKVRGFRTSSNDRWFGPGSSNSHGGSGHEQISGWAGQKG